MKLLPIKPLMRRCRTICMTLSMGSIILSCSYKMEPKSLEESFESIPIGNLSEYNSKNFKWSSKSGNAEITSNKYKNTPNSLRIFGGKEKGVIMSPIQNIGKHGMLSFYAERWTRREPFEFRVYGLHDESWVEIYVDDQTIIAGKFQSLIEIPLKDTDYSSFKFMCTSPENTGVFIDDITIANNAPLTLDSISIKHIAVPILKGKECTPILRVTINAIGLEGKLDFNGMELDFEGSSGLENINSVKVVFTGNDLKFNDEKIYSRQTDISDLLKIEGSQLLSRGANYFWVCINPDKNADLENVVQIGCNKVFIDDEEKLLTGNSSGGKNRMGIALRKHGDDGVDTYRIPGLVTTNNGTLIAVYDIRRNSATDLQGDIDVGMSRSTDGGQTWEPMKVIMDMEEWGGLPEDQNGVGDPSILLDRNTNTIWVAGIWAHGQPDERNWHASKKGLSPKLTSQFVLVKSEDDGITWSDEINITKQIKDPKWHLLLQGPGKGITLSDGTLVFPAQYKDENEIPHSTIIWSTDLGNSWQIGTGAKDSTTEAQVIELDDGRLMLNMRDDRNRTDPTETNGRSVYITKDMGKTWVMHPTSRQNILQESTCQASIIKEIFSVDGKERSLVLFSNPNTKRGRHHMSIKISFDDGSSWDLSRTILLDELSGRGYSCMTKIDDEHLGIIYEGSQADMTFQIIPIRDL